MMVELIIVCFHLWQNTPKNISNSTYFIKNLQSKFYSEDKKVFNTKICDYYALKLKEIYKVYHL